jgi:excisionase family DNA binding protein
MTSHQDDTPDVSAFGVELTAPEQVYTLDEAAARLGLLRSTVRTCVEQGLIPAVRQPSGDYAILQEDLDRFAEVVGRARSNDPPAEPD